MQTKSNILPIGGMNKDDDPRHFEQGDYLEARNMRIGSTNDQGDDGLIQNIKSTLKTAMPDMGTITGINQLGTVVDEENDLAFIFVMVLSDDSNKFIILKHDFKTGVIIIILIQTADTWGITFDMRFYNPVIVNNNLIWTDNVNDIRMIDVNRIETSTSIGLYRDAIAWDGTYAFDTGYEVGVYVTYGSILYRVIQNTVGIPSSPSGAPTYYGFIPKGAVQFDMNYSIYTGYNIGTFVYDKDKVYIVISDTLGSSITPSLNPTYYTYKCQVVDCYLDISDPTNFTLAALPPLIAAIPAYSSDSSRSINQVRGRTFQFSYRYIYMDWRKSTYAPPSIIAIPFGEEDINGILSTDPSLNNYITLAVNSGNEEVIAIEIIARDSDDIATWYQVDEMFFINDNKERLVSPETDLNINFYNDSTKTIIDPTLVYTLFSFVPIKAKHIEVVEGNRLAIGHLTEGYDKIQNLSSITLSWEDVAALTTKNVDFTASLVYTLTLPNIINNSIQFVLPTENPGAVTFVINIDNTVDQITFQYIYNGADSYPITVRDGLVAAFLATGEPSSELAVCPEPSDYKLCLYPRAYTGYFPYWGWDYSGYYITETDESVSKYPTLSTGFTHSWGIVYRDIVGRMSPIIGAGSLTKYIPFATEDVALDTGQIPVIDFNINQNPPAWAESYEIVYAGNKSTSWFLYLIGYDWSLGRNDHEVYDFYDLRTDKSRVKIQKSQLNTRSHYDNWEVEEYVFEKGDRIRLIGKVDEYGVLVEGNLGINDTEITGVYDDVDSSGDTDTWIYFNTWPKTTDLIDLNPKSAWVQIYRPKLELSTGLYFTTGMTFNVDTNANGFKYHEGDTNQVVNASGEVTSPAIVRNTSHDSFKYIRNFRNEDDDTTWRFWAESQYASDWYLSEKLTSSGNPIPDLDNLEQKSLTKRLRHGGILNVGTQINNIAMFDFDNFVDLKDQHGPIEGIRFVGFTLKVLQYIKVSSIFIGRQESFNAGGEADYQFTNQVFGTVRPNEENWGTVHPESVTVFDRHLYYWDQSEGVVVRNSANGQVEISEAKMKRYFADLAKTLDAEVLADQRVIFTYSKETDELFCMFGIGSASKEIVTFSEKQKRWKSIIELPFNLGQFYWLGKRLFHVNSESLFEWWVGSDYMNIGDNVVEGKISFYANSEPAKIKTFDAITIYQTGARPIFESIIVPEKSSAVSSEMKTYIYDVNMKEKEGVYYCQIMRDINDPDPKNATENAKLMNGRRLRGIFANIIMKITATTKVTLSNIIALTTPSERSQ